jgi:hypothetical protein
MSESRAKLEQILELLLSEDNEKAEEMLHEYVVAKARSEYERVLEAEDEVEESEEAVEESEETFDEVVDKSNDFENDILADEEEIENDESGIEEGEDEEGEEAGEEGEEDLETKVDDLEAELEDLRAEFEKLMGGEESDDEMDMGDEEGAMDMGGEEGEDEMMDSVEYDLDEEVEDGEVVEEATKLQNSVAAPKAPVADASNGTSPVAKHKAGWETGAPVKAKDGGAGNAGANKAKNHTPTNNIGLKPAKVNVPKA